MKSTSGRKRILWARNMILDIDLFAKTETEILHAMVERGYEIYYLSGHSRQKLRITTPRIRLFSVPLGRSLPFKYHLFFTTVQFFSFPFLLLKFRPHFLIVDWDSMYGLIPTLALCRLLGVKVVLDIRSTPTPVESTDQKSGTRHHLQNLLFGISLHIAKRQLNGITIITNLMKQEVSSRFRINPKHIGVWSSGVSAEQFRQDLHFIDARKLKQELGVTGKFVVFYHGGFSQSRGILDAIRAMSVLKSQNPNVVLFLLGKGDLRTLAEMKKAIEDNDLQGSVVLHDAVDYVQVPKYIAMCDVAVVPLLDLPQWRTQCPLKVLEYLAMKKVVILSDIPCHREIVGKEKCAIYLPSVSPEYIASSIEYAYDNRNKLSEWGATGRVIVQRSYTWEKIAECLSSYLENMGDPRSRIS